MFLLCQFYPAEKISQTPLGRGLTDKQLRSWKLAIWLEEKRGCTCVHVYVQWPPCRCLTQCRQNPPCWAEPARIFLLNFSWANVLWKLHCCSGDEIILLLIKLKKFKVRICLLYTCMFLYILSCLHQLIVIIIPLSFLPLPLPQDFSLSK